MATELPPGVLRVDKPEGPTSHDVVAAARRALGTHRIGHTGTLDPFASGLLLLCLGSATRLAEYLTDLPKTYRARVRLGTTTDTADRTGVVTASSEHWRELGIAQIEEALRAHTGPLRQVPPAFSAKQLGGERAYVRARRGESVTLEPVTVVVYRMDLLALEPPDLELEVECSSGTYVRALARDLGAALGTGAHLAALRRTRIGPHDVADAIAPEQFDDRTALRTAWLAPLDALPQVPRVQLSDADASTLEHGVPVAAPPDSPRAGPILGVHAGRLLAVTEPRDGRLIPRKVFPRE